MSEEIKEQEVLYCQCCDKPLKDNDECYVDQFLWNLFSYIFCNEECRDDYVNSK